MTVNRIPDSRLDVTADIGYLPNLPRNHYSYVLSKSETLPIVAIIGNVAPEFTDGVSVSVSVDENTEAGTNIGDPISATDMDTGDTLIYTIGGIDAESFDIDSETGQLKTKAALDYETKFFYSVTITVSDGLLTDTITVTINVIDVLDNFAPTFTEGAITVRSVSENTEAGTNIGTPITAVDTVADTLTYTVGGIDVTSFDIDTETGQLKTKASLDFERKPLYLVNVTASDGQLTDMITVIIRLIDLADTEFIPVSLPLADRTPQVRDAIVDNVVVANNLIETPAIDDITDAQIAAVTILNLRDAGITKLQVGDFSGMPNLTDIYLHNNMLMGLPAGIFEGLTARTTLRLDNNLLNPMPIFVSIQQVDANQFQVIVPTGAPFDIVVPISVTDGNISGGATTATVQQGTLKSETFTIVPTDNLITPIIDIGKLPGLPRNHYGYVLARSTACNRTPELVSAVEKMYPLLMHCQNVAAVDLAVITHLNLVDMDIKSLRTHDFSGMLSLTTLYLNNNELTHLPKDLFDGLVSLKTVSLRGNKLTQLPDGIFEGFVSLVSLDLSENAVDAILMTVSLEKVGEDGFKAVIPAGAPFNMTLTLTATNGSITDDIDTITIPQGRVESDTYTITRTPDTLDAVTVDIDTLQGLPPLHSGYELVKSDALPLEILPLINVPPVFIETTPTTYTIRENTEEGINIGAAITALDANNDTLFYTLSGGDADAFEINPYTGQLTTKEDLDFETKSTYTVIVTASDGVNTVSITVTINVANVDENRAPIFTEGTNTIRYVAENATAGTNIGDPVVATDPDENTLTYSLDGTEAVTFSIDSTTGQLRTEAPMDYETKSFYSVIITASDGELTASIDIVINVIDVVENPPVFTQGTTTTITITTESETAETITATDADGDTLTYALNGEDAELFDIDPDTGELEVKEGVTLDPDKTYKVTVTVSDGTHITSIDVNINIDEKSTDQRSDGTDQVTQTPNNAPVFTEGGTTTRSVPENTEIGENIGDAITATDADNDTLIYTLSGTDAGSFSVENNTGQLQTRVALDYETQDIYSVPITVTDGKDTDIINVTINVTDIDETTTQNEGTQPPPQQNRAPVFSEGTTTVRYVAENTQLGTNVGTPVSATDQDAGDTLTYRIGTSGDATSFSINTNTGQLITSAVFDYETKTSYSITVIVSDGEASDTIDVTINVTNDNDPPVFTPGYSTSIDVAESVAIGTEIGTYTATDQDTNDTLTYSISSNNDTDHTAFEIGRDDGTLKTSTTLDYETKTLYTLIVSVSDGNNGTDSITVRIHVTDVIEIDPPISSRTPIVRDAIIRIAGVDSSEDITSDHLNSITRLRLWGVSISSLSSGDFDGLTSLSELTLWVNDLTSLPTGIFDDLTNLMELNLRNNKLSCLPPAIFDKLTNLKNLNLSENKLSSLPPAIFHKLTNLEFLNLSINELSSIPPGLFDNLNKILLLNLNYNELTSLPSNIFDDLSNIAILRLSFNKIESLPSNLFDNLTLLSELILRQNKLTSLPSDIFDSLSSMTELHLDGNKISSLPIGIFDNLSTLGELHLVGCNLSSLPDGIFDNLSALWWLKLKKNKITALPNGIFDNLSSLQGLQLEDNSLTSIPSGIFDKLTALRWLHLNQNQLTSLPSGMCDNTKILKWLYLHENQLTSLPSGIFDKLTVLEYLYIYQNQLTSLPDGIFKNLSRLNELKIQNNAVDPLPIVVSLEKIEEGQFKVVVHTGAPFSMNIPISINNGSTNDGKTDLRVQIHKGKITSRTVNVVRTEGTTDAVTVNIGNLPSIPPDDIHDGYALVKSADLPLEIIPAIPGAPTKVTYITLSIPNNNALLSNYPNPFNPETWLPYQLSKASDVTTTIYNMRGVVVRRLMLGHQKVGFYTSRRRAAHWDGRNAIGEKVAAGVYFYTFKAGDWTATRKMLIRMLACDISFIVDDLCCNKRKSRGTTCAETMVIHDFF